MAWALSDPRDAAALAASSPRRLSYWQRLLRALSDPYRPERHYMRGPGPKWFAKHGRDRVAGQAGVAGNRDLTEVVRCLRTWSEVSRGSSSRCCAPG